ncbi:glycosyltransferase [Paracoccus sp. SCSIO 75233]|uniref:glycosyltransferase n=1 Tax=Paracoccus sp. SCSIO 75233 TaxID=3017782 RepID=UPI0022F0FBFA|nr:glycosyltransferase [Paracoccus sp. SCSIO 75233]WBU54816.1 glycosyltransferase [Paracoccus sp. SCSIO 75233]
MTGWIAITLLGGTTIQILAFMAAHRQRPMQRAAGLTVATEANAPPEFLGKLPIISVMIPLFEEDRVTGELLRRLERLDYPRQSTDIVLVVEDTDRWTRDALAKADLPGWIRVVFVPPGNVQTKPRALNYALNFCRGEIIGIWDAEDRPEPDQLRKVAHTFHFADDDVACLQGRLDYFNPRSNWLARCFTIEYASWFRAILPGIDRLGLTIPLGGTTMFIRREVLEPLGGWDAWNVTEDADLGVRLSRHGWRTEIIETTTDEEANCRPTAWIRQRSRWMKGYLMTWAVHMRNPVRLCRQLGARRFIALQFQLLGSVSQSLLAPLVWSFWLLAFGLPHPLAEIANGRATTLLVSLFVISELVSMAVRFWAVRGKPHRHLLPWVPLTCFYFPIGCVAAWKAVYEMVTRPFYWDKTAHGVFDEGAVETVTMATHDGIALVPLRGSIKESTAGEPAQHEIPLHKAS